MTRLVEHDIPPEREPRRICPLCNAPVRTFRAKLHWSHLHPEVSWNEFRVKWNLAPAI